MTNLSNHLPTDNRPIKLIIDTDGGVDDVTAIAWLLSQTERPVEVLGIITVAGNTSVENAANNVLLILNKVGRSDIRVLIGAKKPLLQAVSGSGSFVHGPDGLWFAGAANRQDVGGVSTDVAGFYRQHAAPDVTLLTLGPLTNLALALDVAADTVAKLGRIVVLGGSIGRGSRTPAAEYNIWYDPEAADKVFKAGLPLTIIPFETFCAFTLSGEDFDRLAVAGTAVSQFLNGPLRQYDQAQTGLGGIPEMPDVAAMIYALYPALGSSQAALVKVIAGIVESDAQRLARGKTIIGFSPASRITMIADDVEISELVGRVFSEADFDLDTALAAILGREPDEIQVVTEIQAEAMHTLFMQAMTNE